MAEIIKAPNQLKKGFSIFLAGSIELGKAEHWQDRIEKKLKDIDVIIYNPRRDDWDSSIELSIHDKRFREQVEWELDALEQADIIIMYFDKNTKSPICLLELGLFGRTGKMIICCPEGYWRKGNVDIVCKRYNITQVFEMDNLIDNIKKIVREKNT